MTAASSQPAWLARRIACTRCGTAFDCGTGGTGGGCWCADEAVRMPLPAGEGEDCLCPSCLRQAAAAGHPG